MSNINPPWYALAILIDIIGHRQLEKKRRDRLNRVKRTSYLIEDQKTKSKVENNIDVEDEMVDVDEIINKYTKFRYVVAYLLDKYDMIHFLDRIMPDFSKYKFGKIKRTKQLDETLIKLYEVIEGGNKVKTKLLDYHDYIDYLGYVAYKRKQDESLKGGNVMYMDKKLDDVEKLAKIINKFNYKPYDEIKKSTNGQFVVPTNVVSIYNTKISELNNAPIYDTIKNEMSKIENSSVIQLSNNLSKVVAENNKKINDKIAQVIQNINEKQKHEKVDIYSELLMKPFGIEEMTLYDRDTSTLPLYEPTIDMTKFPNQKGGHPYNKNTIDNILFAHDKTEELTKHFTDHVIEYNIVTSNKHINFWCEEYYDILFDILNGTKTVICIINNDVMAKVTEKAKDDKKMNGLMRQNLEILQKSTKGKTYSVNVTGHKYCFQIITLLYYYLEP